MTLTADRGADWSGESFERRRASTQPRRSWASRQPFERRRTPLNADPSLRALAWRSVGPRYAVATAGLDAFVATGVGAALLAPHYSFALAAALAAGGAAVFVASVALGQGYRRELLGDGPREFQSVLRSSVALAILLMVLGFLLGVDVPRELVLVGVPALAGLACLARHLHRRRLHGIRRDGSAMMSTILVGDEGSARRVIADLARAAHHGYRVDGVCLPDLSAGVAIDGVPVVGGTADVVQVVADRAAEVVIVTGSTLSGDALRRLSWALGRAGAHMVVAPDIVEVSGPRLTVRPTAGLSLLEVEVDSPRRRLVAKSVIDMTLATLGLLAVLPVLLGAALAIRLTSAGPAFFRQTRVGVDGAPFTIWKLRTMYVDADARRDALLAQSEGNGVLFKMRRDPRVTTVGRVLRKYSLDELPQLWNVVRGDMSLVGPRPPLESEVRQYEDEVHRRLRVKPGLTGLWQVSGRSDLDWDESVRLDLRYVDNWSVAMDLMILWKTGRAVLGGSGAY
ncbi:sugar transferase [Cellulomonas fengjieae]|uniref:sugar transferase n=1 Tax=Cellulomonas fengjieae TaxID=2819978 RepID=UPI001AAEC297|nr:sugar transferase [Cellulomonas fengjieae]MBO3100548.1 sugar transferase [Cellulomonas fengjieae]